MSRQGGVFDFLRSRGEEFMAQVTNALMSDPRFVKAVQAALRGKEWFEQAVAQALRTLNVPTRTEFKRALSRIEALEQQVAELKRAAAPPARGRSAARKKRPAKKRAARKAAAAPPPPAPAEPGPAGPAE